MRSLIASLLIAAALLHGASKTGVIPPGNLASCSMTTSLPDQAAKTSSPWAACLLRPVAPSGRSARPPPKAANPAPPRSGQEVRLRLQADPRHHQNKTRRLLHRHCRRHVTLTQGASSPRHQATTTVMSPVILAIALGVVVKRPQRVEVTPRHPSPLKSSPSIRQQEIPVVAFPSAQLDTTAPASSGSKSPKRRVMRRYPSSARLLPVQPAGQAQQTSRRKLPGRALRRHLTGARCSSTERPLLPYTDA